MSLHICPQAHMEFAIGRRLPQRADAQRRNRLNRHVINSIFAAAFNSRDINSLLSLYEPEAVLIPGPSGQPVVDIETIGVELGKLLRAPGVMVSTNKFCIVHGDLAMLRADFVLRDGDHIVASGSTAELIRRQADGTWLYIIDHAAGASLP